MFKKNCLRCSSVFEGSRNHRFCSNCRWKRVNKGRVEKWPLDPGGLSPALISYFLGFCCADGSVYLSPKGKVASLRWYSTDLQIMEDLSRILGYGRPLSIARVYGEKTEWLNILYAKSAEFFVSKGLRKKKEELSFSEIKADLFPFLLGFLDGDGTIRTVLRSNGEALDSVVFLGREKLIMSLQDALEKNGFIGRVNCANSKRLREGFRNVPIFVLTFRGLMGMALLDELYSSVNIRLFRKYEIYKRLKDANRPYRVYKNHMQAPKALTAKR